MQRLLSLVTRRLRRPQFRLMLAIGVFITCLFEAFDTVVEEMLGFKVGVHHGLALFAVAEGTRALHDLLESFEAASSVAEAAELARLETEVETVEQLEKTKGNLP